MGNDSEIYNSEDEYPNMQSGQAMFARANLQDPVVRFEEDMKADSSMLVSRGTPAATSIPMISTMLYTAAGALRDGNRVVFDDAYANGVDREDAIKLNNNGINFGLLRAGKQLAVEARPGLKATDTLYYNMAGIPAGDFKLNISAQHLRANGLQGELVDKFNRSRTPVSLTAGASIPFSITADAASKAADRFMLVFRQAAVVLPVNFISVAARRQPDRSIGINWQVANEVNIVRYEVERSADGLNFSGILTRAAAGSSNYAHQDMSPLNKDNFYRIKAVGVSGDISYSSIVKVVNAGIEPGIAVYPNPVRNNTINLQLSRQPFGRYALELVNVSGQVVYKGSIEVNNEQVSKVVSPDQTLKPGSYELIIRSEIGEQQVTRVLVQ
ncbi:MAG: T9SS type A sorting domain-containing protein [Sphingobacteriales bacterium]|nr:MAG: T9SS type A sorting domain-containing protein [Sphingobacteriales bacterium]